MGGNLKLYPSADGIALALVAAARLTGEYPECALTNPVGNRARMIAMAALLECFPGIPANRITSIFCSTSQALNSARRAACWRQDCVEAVCDALTSLAPPHAVGNVRKLGVLVDEDLLPLNRERQRQSASLPIGEPSHDRSALAQREREQTRPWKPMSISAVAKRDKFASVGQPIRFEGRG